MKESVRYEITATLQSDAWQFVSPQLSGKGELIMHWNKRLALAIVTVGIPLLSSCAAANPEDEADMAEETSQEIKDVK